MKEAEAAAIQISEEQDTVVVDVNNLRKSFGAQEVLKDVSLKLFNSENLVILGKSGSGKSVLIKCLVKLLEPDSGEIKIFGRQVSSMNKSELAELRKQVGFLFQSGALYDSMTVKENLEFPLRRIKKDLGSKAVREKVMEVLENVGLADALEKMPSQLSGGMRKRIGLARTLILDPKIMLYDEPTTGLDPITSDEISELINEVKDKYKTASIIITHDIRCARIIGDRIVMIKDGGIYAEGTFEELENVNDKWINSFFKN